MAPSQGGQPEEVNFSKSSENNSIPNYYLRKKGYKVNNVGVKYLGDQIVH